ncbi:hypothetical protein, partial [Rhodoligotrophos appendicifer]
MSTKSWGYLLIVVAILAIAGFSWVALRPSGYFDPPKPAPASTAPAPAAPAPAEPAPAAPAAPVPAAPAAPA